MHSRRKHELLLGTTDRICLTQVDSVVDLGMRTESIGLHTVYYVSVAATTRGVLGNFLTTRRTWVDYDRTHHKRGRFSVQRYNSVAFRGTFSNALPAAEDE